jgi:hypothetical protein
MFGNPFFTPSPTPNNITIGYLIILTTNPTDVQTLRQTWSDSEQRKYTFIYGFDNIVCSYVTLTGPEGHTENFISQRYNTETKSNRGVCVLLPLKNLLWAKLRDYAISRVNPNPRKVFLVRVVKM